MFKKAAVVVLAAAMSACSIQQAIVPAEVGPDIVVCIIENRDVRRGFLREYRSALSAKGIASKMVEEYADIPRSCEWTSTYLGRWSWDLALYLAYAEIKVFRNDNLIGEATYDATGGDYRLDKWIDAEVKIRELVDQLFHVGGAPAN